MSEIHLVQDSDGDSHFEVWLDTDIAECDGLCIGVGTTRDKALACAQTDLKVALSALRDLIEHEGDPW